MQTQPTCCHCAEGFALLIVLHCCSIMGHCMHDHETNKSQNYLNKCMHFRHAVSILPLIESRDSMSYQDREERRECKKYEKQITR